MFGSEVRELFIQVLTSWQVIAVTVVLVIYFFLASYVARTHHKRPGQSFVPKAKPKAPEAAAPETDELGIEEDNTVK